MADVNYGKCCAFQREGEEKSVKISGDSIREVHFFSLCADLTYEIACAELQLLHLQSVSCKTIGEGEQNFCTAAFPNLIADSVRVNFISDS